MSYAEFQGPSVGDVLTVPGYTGEFVTTGVTWRGSGRGYDCHVIVRKLAHGRRYVDNGKIGGERGAHIHLYVPRLPVIVPDVPPGDIVMFVWESSATAETVGHMHPVDWFVREMSDVGLAREALTRLDEP